MTKLLLFFFLGSILIALGSFVYSVLRRKEDTLKLQSIIEGSPIPTFVIQQDHQVLYWNRALAELSGIRADDVVGTKLHWKAFYRTERPCLADLIVDGTLDMSEWYSGKYQKSELIEGAFAATDYFPDIGDSGRWFHFTAAPIKDSRGNLFGAIETLEDISDQKYAEEELFRMKKLESFCAFAGAVAKDFDALLTAIQRSILITKLSSDDESKRIEEGLAIAEKASLQAKELAYQLNTFAEGGVSLRKVEDIGSLLRETVEGLRIGPDINLKISIPDDLWPVQVDRSQMRQVMENLVVNALEAMPEGGNLDITAGNVTVSGKEETSLKRGGYIKISVKDTGEGIRKEHLSRIYDPYFTTKTTAGRKRMGLGLSISYSIIKNHEGAILVDSEPGAGTDFHIFLPAAV